MVSFRRQVLDHRGHFRFCKDAAARENAVVAKFLREFDGLADLDRSLLEPLIGPTCCEL
jgi:hypothetical protein